VTPEKQRVAIAEVCGYEPCVGGLQPKGDILPKHFRKKGREYSQCPDYPHDLNAMQSAVLAQNDKCQIKFATEMGRESVRQHKLMHQLTVEDWARIFLRTLGLWEDDK